MFPKKGPCCWISGCLAADDGDDDGDDDGADDEEEEAEGSR